MIFGKISDKKYNELSLSEVEGLNIHYNFLEQSEEDVLFNIIDGLPWREELKHNVQYYGFGYNYKKKKSSIKDYMGSIPINLNFIKSNIGINYNQLVIDKYISNQGMRYHKKSSIFDDNMIICPLNSDCVIRFKKGDIIKKVLVKRRAVLVLSGKSLTEWEHGITYTKTDKFNNRVITRDKEIILMTFRNVLIT